MTEEIDNWSWKKFFMGFINGKNYAKAIVLGVCMIVILVIVTSVYQTISSKFRKPTQGIESNNGIIATENEDKSGNSYSLLNLLNWR